MSITCEKCKKRPARLILEIVEDDPSKDDEWCFRIGEEEEENDNLIERVMKVCRDCAQEIQKSMLGGVTLVKPIGKK